VAFFHKTHPVNLLQSLSHRCYGFLNIFAEKFSKKFGVFLLKTKLTFEKIDHNIGI
jgi:hypothetical protein